MIPSRTRFAPRFALALSFVLGCHPVEHEQAQQSSAETPSGTTRSLSSATRGEGIYTRGKTVENNPLMAIVGAGNVSVDATLLPCAGCHGKDARGRSEGGVSPSNLRWDALTRPYEVTEGTGRRRPPYTDKLFVRAVTMGLDAGGKQLDPSMPRYRLSREDAASLVAYLETMDQAHDPGITEDEVRIGAFFPANEGSIARGELARAGLQRLFDEIQQQNGIFGRHLVLTETSDARVLDEHPFAILGVFVGDDADKLLQRARDQGTPVLGIAANKTAVSPGGNFFALLAEPSVDKLDALGPLHGRTTKARAIYEAAVADGAHKGRSEERYDWARWALAAGDVLVEALRRSGRDTNRDKLIASMEAMHDHVTGLLPPVTFSKSRRIGVTERMPHATP